MNRMNRMNKMNTFEELFEPAGLKFGPYGGGKREVIHRESIDYKNAYEILKMIKPKIEHETGKRWGDQYSNKYNCSQFQPFFLLINPQKLEVYSDINKNRETLSNLLVKVTDDLPELKNIKVHEEGINFNYKNNKWKIILDHGQTYENGNLIICYE